MPSQTPPRRPICVACLPVNPQATALERVEVVGRFADVSSTTVTYSAKINFTNTFSTPVQMELPLTIQDDGKIGAPLIYGGSNFNLTIDYYAAPGGNGNLHLGQVNFTTDVSGKISGPVVCKATIF